MNVQEPQQVLTKIIDLGMLPVFYHSDFDKCKNLIDACHACGQTAFEFTNRGAHAAENFGKLKAHISQNIPNMLLGIGSIVSATDAQKFIDLGADFVVSPIFDQQLSDYCKAQNILFVPGCASPTEMFRAYSAGNKLVKLFPASAFGPSYVSNILGPMPWLKIMPTGGVEPHLASLKAWFGAGVVCVGIGSQLLKSEWIESNNIAALEAEIAQVLKNIVILKSNLKN